LSLATLQEEQGMLYAGCECDVIVRDDEFDDVVREERNIFGFDSKNCLINTKAIPSDITPLKAVRISIAKWELIVTRLEEGHEVANDGGYLTCALCTKYYNNGACKRGDTKCPIAMATNNTCCTNTPYRKFIEIDHEDEDARLMCAMRELRFLQGVYEMMRCIWDDDN
jgi:hypothetical protein